MAQDAEKIKTLLSFKQKLEKKVSDLESEIKELHTIIETVNSLIIEKGFKRAKLSPKPTGMETVKEDTTISSKFPPQKKHKKDVIPLKTVTGELLANLIINNDSLRIVPAKDNKIIVTQPPFTNFLVERVLAKMHKKDKELADSGQKKPENAFMYSILQDGSFLREIVLKNVDKTRLRELRSSVRWTFEKMWEKNR